MSDRLLVATRKGLFVLHADGKDGWSLGEPDFVGEPVSMAMHDPRDGTLYAALNLGHFGVKLHRRRAGSADWEECAVPVYPPQP
ncbi:MAG TPA: exo-alpha-sialidase, partial [Paraburkholderia sp.]